MFETDGSQLCAQTDPDMFFSQDAERGNLRGYYKFEKEAKKLCGLCDLQAACLQYALDNPELEGIWGGTTPMDRNRLRRRSA